MLPSFSSNAYADHCLLLDSDVILPSKLPPSFLSFSPSFDYFLGGHDQENELHFLTQSFNCSSLGHSARRVPPGITNVKSMMPQADGVAVPSFPNDTNITGYGTPCTAAAPNFDHPNNNSKNKNNKADCNKEIIKNIFVAGDHQQRKRSGKKDRHSKIVTAQGPRDRRMRLSLDIARRFFDLQDRLGYDKASKTVEWLMSKSKGAIKEVMQGLLHPKEGPCGGRSLSSYTSDCDDSSGVEETPIDYNEDADLHEQNYPLPIITSTGPKSRKNKTVRKPAFILPHGKESRAMARARARERAKEKLSRRMEIGHEKKATTATTTITSRYHPQLEQQGLHFANYPQQTITPISITNPDVVYNFIHEDWAAHGGIHY